MNVNKVTIDNVDCYGEWREDSNAVCTFDDEELDGIYCEGGESWEEVVGIVKDYADLHGTTLIEMEAC